MRDVSGYLRGGGRGGENYIRKHELRQSGPQEWTIASVEDGEGWPDAEGNRPAVLVLVFADGRRFELRPEENLRRMVKLYGRDADRWPGQQITLYFSPDIPNPRNASDPGGIRILEKSRSRASTAPKPAPPAPGPAAAKGNGAEASTPSPPEPAPALWDAEDDLPF